MSAGRFRPLSPLLVFALFAVAGSACSLNTQPTGTVSGHDGGYGPGGGAGAGAGGGAVGGGGTGGSSGSSGTGAAGGVPDGGSAGQENCFDHKDNDGNGLADCGDPACQNAGYSCQTSPPPGWQGFFRTAGDAYDTTSPPPKCPDKSEPIKYLANPLPATCAQCTCGPMQGSKCGPAHLYCSSSSTDCSGATDWSAKFQSCTQAGSPSKLSCRMQAVQPTAVGTCAPSGGQLESTDMWGRWLYVCGAPGTTGGGCAPGLSCAAPGGGAFSGTVCIRRSGEQSCPSGWSTRLVGYQDGIDARGCTPCTCNPLPSSVTCSTGEYTFYDHNDCTCNWHPFCSSDKKVDSTACVDVTSLLGGLIGGSDWGGRYTGAPAPTDGSCSPSGGKPTGEVQTTGAVTYCCL